MIIIDIGRRIASLFSVYHEKDAEANFAAEFAHRVVIVENNWHTLS